MFVLAALVLAASGPGATAAPATAAAGNPDQMVCRQRPVTGSRLRFTRTCMTRREWANHREELTRGMRNFTTREMSSQPAPSITPGSQ